MSIGDIFSTWRDEGGATMFEYALLASLLAVVAIGAVSYVGEETHETFTNITEELAAANNPDNAQNNSGGDNPLDI